MHDVLQVLDVLADAHPWDDENARGWWEDNADRVDALIASRRRPVGPHEINAPSSAM
jgi:hypothetical protein